MLNSRHSEAILSPSLSRITKRMRSSITEHFLHGMFYPALGQDKSVTHVSGTFCYLCLGTLIKQLVLAAAGETGGHFYFWTLFGPYVWWDPAGPRWTL